MGGKVHHHAIETEYVAKLGVAYARRSIRDHVENWLNVGSRLRDDAQNFVSRRLLL
jgi:hypothetical protein